MYFKYNTQYFKGNTQNNTDIFYNFITMNNNDFIIIMND